MAIKFSDTVRNAMADAIASTAGASCLLRIYDNNTSIPASVAASNSTNVKLAELACAATFAPSASGGVLTLNAISNDTSADASGTLSYFRIYKSDGTTAVLQGTAGASAQDMNFGVASFVAGGTVAVTSFTLTMPGA